MNYSNTAQRITELTTPIQDDLALVGCISTWTFRFRPDPGWESYQACLRMAKRGLLRFAEDEDGEYVEVVR